MMFAIHSKSPEQHRKKKDERSNLKRNNHCHWQYRYNGNGYDYAMLRAQKGEKAKEQHQGFHRRWLEFIPK